MGNPVTAVNYDVYRFGTYTHQHTVKDAAGALVNLTGYTAILEIRAAATAPGGTPPAVLHTASTANGQISINAAGYVTVLIPGSLVGAWTFDNALYDLFVTSPTGNDYPIARGKVRVYPSITQSP